MSKIKREVSRLVKNISKTLHKAELEELGISEELALILVNARAQDRNVKESLSDYFGDFPDILPYSLRNISEENNEERKRLYFSAEEAISRYHINRKKLERLQETYYLRKDVDDYFRLLDFTLPIFVFLKNKGYSHKLITGKEFP